LNRTQHLPILVALHAAPSAAVVLHRCGRAGSLIEPLTPESARRLLGVSVCYAGVDLRNRQMLALGGSLSLPRARSRNSALDQAEDALRRLLDKGSGAP